MLNSDFSLSLYLFLVLSPNVVSNPKFSAEIKKSDKYVAIMLIRVARALFCVTELPSIVNIYFDNLYIYMA